MMSSTLSMMRPPLSYVHAYAAAHASQCVYVRMYVAVRECDYKRIYNRFAAHAHVLCHGFMHSGMSWAVDNKRDSMSEMKCPIN